MRPDHPNRPISDLRRIPDLICHDFILSTNGASGNPGTVHGQAFRYLQANGLLVGANDLWIAATAIVHGMPLVTRNERHFQRVPRLQSLGY
jgi:tRNA(fMet)-specific endonuclease VapC